MKTTRLAGFKKKLGHRLHKRFIKGKSPFPHFFLFLFFFFHLHFEGNLFQYDVTWRWVLIILEIPIDCAKMFSSSGYDVNNIFSKCLYCNRLFELLCSFPSRSLRLTFYFYFYFFLKINQGKGDKEIHFIFYSFFFFFLFFEKTT